MSNAGQAALGIVGGIIGFYIGGPTGAAYGFQAGLAVGSVVSPTQLPGTFGPRLTDNRTTTSQIGSPVIEIYGTDATAGTVIWLGDIAEHTTTTEVGGKGGPEQSQTTYSYTQSIAIGLCRGPKGGILRAWENGLLVYDIREKQEGESEDSYQKRLGQSAEYALTFTLYLGDDTQLPDPTIELKEGIGNVPGFRELMYIVFPDRKLRDDQARRHPNFKFEVYDGAPDCFEDPNCANDVVYPWDPNAAIQIGPENPLNIHRYALRARSNSSDPSPPGQPWRTSLADALGDYDAMYGEALGAAERLGWSINSVGPSDNWSSELRPQTGGGPGTRTSVWIHMQTLLPSGGAFLGYKLGAEWIQTIGGDCYALIFGESLPYGGNYVWWTNTYNDYMNTGIDDPLSNQYDLGMYFWWDLDLGERWPNQAFQNNCTGGGGDPPFDPNDAQLMFVPDVIVEVQRLPQSPGPEWTYDDEHDYLALQSFDNIPDGNGIPQVQYGLNPVLRVGSPRSTQGFWESAYADAVFAGLMPGGLSYPDDYPVTQDHAWIQPSDKCSAAGTPVSIASIVRDICNRCTLTDQDIDVSELEDRYVLGYQLTRVMDGRSAIAPLRSIGFFDCVDSGPVLKFPVRGKAPVRTLLLEDLGAHEFDSEAPPAVTTITTQDVELPRQLFVQFRDPARDYETNEQPSPTRLTTNAVNDVYVDVVAAIEATAALQSAEVLWADQWAAAHGKHTFALDSAHVDLEPTDCILVPIDNRNERLRIVSMEDSGVILRRFQAVRDDDGNYVSEAIAEGPMVPPQELQTFDQTTLIILDLPPLQPEDNDAGVYIAAARAGTGNKWGGASIFRSVDGDSFTAQASLTTEVVAGILAQPIGNAPAEVWDYGNEILVTLQRGQFSSRTEEDVLGGANTLAVGAHGRWEIVQFLDAEQVTASGWRLTNLLRGRRGTDHNIATSQAGDRVVMLSGGGLGRMPLTLPELGKPFVYRAVTIGTALGTGVDQAFTGTGEALRPFSPVNVHAERAGDGAITISFVRRDRLLFTYEDGLPTPMSESVEDYEIDILDGSDVVRRVISSSETEFIYSADQQVTDFGALQAEVTVRIYQISTAVGRGHYREATL